MEPPSKLFDVKSAFTPGIVHLLVLAISNAFSDYLHRNYIIETFIPLCLMAKEQAELKQSTVDISMSVFPLVFVPAILADSYIRKIIMLKMMVTVRCGAPVCIVALAMICSQFSYDGNYNLKYQLFTAFLSFKAVSILALPIHAATILDQIVRARDFVLESAQIVTAWLIAEQLTKVVGALVVYFTADDKVNAAYAQIASLAVQLTVTIYFLIATRTSSTLVSPPISYHGAFKVVGCGLDHVYRLIVRICCRVEDPKSLSFSEETKKNCKKFWSLQFALICLLPYFYFVDGVKFCLNCLQPIDNAVLHARSTRELYHHLTVTTIFILVQFFIFPMTYKRKKGFFRVPVRRMYATYLSVGVLGTLAFCMIIWNQKVGPERYISAKMASISIHNMLNSTTTAIIEQSKVLKHVHIQPYGRHVLSFDEPATLVSLELINKVHSIDDYVELEAEGHSTYVLTAFGLEKVEGVERHDTSRNPTKVVVNIICLMVICKGRGYVLLDCGGNYIVRPELVKFGKKIRLEVTRDSQCSAKLFTPKGTIVNTVDFKVDSPVISMAAVDHNETQPYQLVRFDEGQPVPFDEWALMPVQVLTDVVHCLFFVAMAQFIILTAPKTLRTTAIATLFFHRFIAHFLIAKFLCEGGSFSAVTCYISIAVFVVSFLAFIYATTKFATYTLRSDLSPAESLDKARIHPYVSSERFDRNPNAEIRSMSPSTSSRATEDIILKTPKFN